MTCAKRRNGLSTVSEVSCEGHNDANCMLLGHQAPHVISGKVHALVILPVTLSAEVAADIAPSNSPVSGKQSSTQGVQPSAFLSSCLIEMKSTIKPPGKCLKPNDRLLPAEQRVSAGFNRACVLEATEGFLQLHLKCTQSSLLFLAKHLPHMQSVLGA